MPETIRTWLRSFRTSINLTQAEFAEEIGVSRALVGMWEAEKAPILEEHLRVIAQKFPGAPPAPKGAGASVLGLPQFPVSYVLAQMPYGGLVPASEEWGDPLESDSFIEVDPKFTGRNRFACKVVGNSCYPALKQGDLTVWEIDRSPKHGVIVLAQRKGDHGCTVKQLHYDAEEGRDRLIPVNPKYTSPDDGDGWGVVARLVAVIRENDGPERTWYWPSGLRPKHLLTDGHED
jgi:transcriptional regulator with XRE-family HTH domain